MLAPYQTYQPSEQKPKKRGLKLFVIILIVAAITFTILFLVDNSHKAKKVTTVTPTKVVATTAGTVPATTKTQVPVIATPSPLSTELKAAWTAIADTNVGDIDIAIYDNKTGETVRYTDAAGTLTTASIVKLSIAEEVLIQTQKQGILLTPTQLSNMQAMIEYSDNASASTLWNAAGSTTTMNNFFASIGATKTTAGEDGLWGLTQTTAPDQLAVLNALAYSVAPLSNSSKAMINGLLDNIIPSQAWGVSGGIPDGVTVELKNGWLEDSETSDAYASSSSWTVNSIGHVYGNGVDYTIAVLTDGQTTERSGINVIEDLSAATWNALSQ